MSRPIRALAAAVAATALVAVPAAASAHDAENGCEVASASLTWGVKESFRAYIGSAIANGSWEVSDGATYETPSFGWTVAEGSVDPVTGEGQVAFTGTITFTGHEGILNLVLADPIVHFGADGTTLLLDVRSNDTSGALTVDEQDVEFATVPLEIAGAIEPGGAQSWPGLAPVVLTEAGAAAFGGFYAAGDELDPISFDLALSADCAVAEAPATAEPTATPEAIVDESPAAQEEGPNPWPVIGIAAAVVAAAGAVAGIVAARRRRGSDS